MTQCVEHKVKCWPDYYEAIKRGDKNFDVRRDDRGYQRGDTLLLQKYGSGHGYYTDPVRGRFSYDEIRREITYVLTGGQFGIEPGYVVLSLKELTPGEQEPTR